ncbi:hypothetical protein GA0115240_153529 [Streptomyces sp. DvalAA-14]|uniref:hypothetical protein n=1 Tax=unclassified Streptomyces TaxID=2593676 RepID=UPI00081BB21C|nr:MULTISPECIES: hypothetical protein [unclassified Streptomyces]SCE35022.1 hypothetical protein GA0115240_153529 [Streptomyces sp. DvalAA-14]
MSLFLFLIIAAIVLGLIGVAVGGLGYLLVIGIVLFAADLGYGFWRLRRKPRVVR